VGAAEEASERTARVIADDIYAESYAAQSGGKEALIPIE